MLEIFDDYMELTVADKVVATAKWSKYRTADCTGAWTVSWCTNRLFNRHQAITALTVAELRAAGLTDDDPVVASLLSELRW
jgi:hypothetical protein